MTEYHKSLIKWVNSFDSPATLELNLIPINTLDELHDGVLLFGICQSIAPSIFASSLVKKETGDNWLLKVNNLKSLVLKLDAFYSTVLGQQANLADIDLQKIGKEKSLDHIASLTEFVLGACVQCSTKDKYIQRIVSLDHVAQQHLMQAIERIMNSVSEAPATHTDQMTNDHDQIDSDSHLHSHAEEPPYQSMLATPAVLRERGDAHAGDASHHGSSAGREERDVLNHALQTLQKEHLELQDKYANLELHSESVKEENTILLNRLEGVEARLIESEAKNKDIHGIKAELEYLRSQAVQDAKELENAQRKASESTVLNKEMRKLRDEVDALRERAAMADHMEATLLKYKKRVEEVVEIKRQLRESEARASEYAEQCLDLEERAQKVPGLKAQLAAYKARIGDLESQEADSFMNLGVMKEELDRARNDASEARQDSERRAAEVAQLERRIEVILGNVDLDKTVVMDDGEGEGGESLNLADELKMNLKGEGVGEGDRIKSRQVQSDAETLNRIELLESMLDDSRRLKDKALRECAEARQELNRARADYDTMSARLKGENDILTERLSSAAHEAKKMARKVEDLSRDNERREAECESVSNALSETQNELITLKTQLSLVNSDARTEASIATEDLKSRYEEEAVKLKQRVSECEGVVSVLESKVAALEDEKVALTSELDELRVENKSHMTELHALMREKDALSSDLIHAREDAVEREQMHAKFQAQIAEKTSEVARYRSELQRMNDSRIALANSTVGGGGEGKGEGEGGGQFGREIEMLKLKLEREEGLLAEARARVSAADAERMTLQAERDKLQSFLNQAKIVIQEHKTREAQTAARDRAALEEQFGAAIAELQKEIAEKEREARFLKRAKQDAVSEQRREEHLIMSAFYELGLELSRLKQQVGGAGGVTGVGVNLASSGTIGVRTPPRPVPVSWLGRQREKKK